MGFLDGLAPALGAVGGSFLGGLMDASNQESFMEKQDKINKENATIAYNRQRELTQDQALLHKRGMEQAGYNTAFGSNGNVTTSANVDQASPVSVPSPQGYGQQLSTAFGSFLQNSLVNAQRKNVDADTNAKNIDNATRAIKNALEIGKQKQDIGVSMLNYAKDAFKFAVDKQYYDRQQSAKTDEMEADAKRAQSLQAIDEVNAMFQYSKNEADLQKAYQEFENLKKVYDLTDAQIVTEKGKPRVQLSEIRKNDASASASWAQANLSDSQKLAQDIQNGINSDDRVVKAAVTRLINSAREAGPQSFSEYAWSVFNDPNATLGQKWKAGFASILGWVERSLGGDSSRLPGQVYDDLKTAATHVGKGIRERMRSKPGKNRIPVWRR